MAIGVNIQQEDHTEAQTTDASRLLVVSSPQFSTGGMYDSKNKAVLFMFLTSINIVLCIITFLVSIRDILAPREVLVAMLVLNALVQCIGVIGAMRLNARMLNIAVVGLGADVVVGVVRLTSIVHLPRLALQLMLCALAASIRDDTLSSWFTAVTS